ncbi:hypothetical protein ACFU6S_44280 [Streptomyces sp. NPDC057456]
MAAIMTRPGALAHTIPPGKTRVGLAEYLREDILLVSLDLAWVGV